MRYEYLRLNEKHSNSSMNNILGGFSTVEITHGLAHCSISVVPRLGTIPQTTAKSSQGQGTPWFE